MFAAGLLLKVGMEDGDSLTLVASPVRFVATAARPRQHVRKTN